MSGKKRALMWAAAILLTASAFVLWNTSGVLLAAAALLLLPIDGCQRFFDRLIAWKWLIVILLIAAALCLVVFAPSGNTPNSISSFDPNFFLE